MGFDRTGATADNPNEAAKEPPPPDRRPPADRPGAEGVPSRADSRNGAAAANDFSSQTAENQSEKKPDSPEAPQETTDGEDNTTSENKPETSGPSESNEDLSTDDRTTERPSNPSQESLGATSDTTRPSDGINGPEDADRRNHERTAAHDSTTPSETDTVTASPNERSAGEGAIETPSVDSTNEPPRDSLDASKDVGDGELEPQGLTVDAAEASVRSSEAEEQSESIGGPQTDSSGQTFPTGDVSSDAMQASDGPREEGAEGEADEDLGSGPTESTERPDQRLERRDETRPEVASDAEGTAITSSQDIGDRLTVHGTPLHEYLDPVGAAAWSNDIGDVIDERSGDRIVDGESDKDSRFEKLRKKGFEKGDDALDVAGKATNRAHDLLARQPPAGHVETRSGPDVTPAPHQAIDVGDALTAAMMAGVVFNDAIRRIHGKAIRRRERDDAGNR